jgi:acyl transferase domain-containing protein/NADPH:quinone reductase-like Zn-dependent oxidoreductase/acyl carrier protein
MNKVMPKEGIAIVGYSHRFPGEERGDFWDLLLKGEDLVTEVAEDRWAKETYLHPNKSEPGRAYSFASGSVGDIFGFDAAFFGISPREAAQMDPQQRLLLELTWEAFEKAGIKPSSWRGSDAGVFVGISSTDNVYLSVDDLAAIDSTSATGNTNSIAANRLSYFFDLRGPSMSLDTACSSSLVAFHQACQMIRCGDSRAAIVAGVSLHLHPMGFINFSKTSMLSHQGRCTPFDEAGAGYARSEGAGVVLLKRLSDAVADGDEILAVVAASGVNCDGKTSSLTIPSAEAQARLLEEVYQKAGILPEEVSYIEAHGTGTQVGDPIETCAIGEAIGQRRSSLAPLPIGSVKSNIGHLEAASGMAGLVKSLLVLRHRVIPPTIHLKEVNPKIPLQEWGLTVPVAPTPLPAKGRLVIGVNSFGFGGANAHVILESPIAKKERKVSKGKTSQDPAPLFLSAASEEALKSVAKEYVSFLKKTTDVSVDDLAQAVTSRREWLPYRLAVTGETGLGVSAALENWLLCGTDESVVEGRSLEKSGNPVFVFSGNGSQYAGMGRQLLSESKIFTDAIAEVDTIFARYADYSLREVLEDPEKESMLRLTEVAQPALFAIQVGLVRLLKEYGITPGAVIGHSVGEVAAAWSCGALSLEQAVHLIHERSLQQGKTKGSGEMTAVALGADELGKILHHIDPKIRPAVAGINSPKSSTLAGTPEGLLLCEEILADQGVRFKRLDLDYAFHSSAMDSIRNPLLDHLTDLTPTKGEIPFCSTVEGKTLSGEELGPDYWWRNVRDPVLFGEALEGLIERGSRVFIEVGPHPVLRTYVKECLREVGVEGLVATPMIRTSGTFSQFLRGVLEVIQSGKSQALDTFFRYPISRRVDLPTYPWQKIRFETPHTGEAYRLSQRAREHPLLGYRLKEGRFQWENHLDTALYPYLADHKVGGVIVFPAAGFVEVALAAGSLCFGSPLVDLEDLEIHAPLLLEEKKSKTIRVTLDELGSILTIKSRERLSEEPWMTHVTVRVLPSTTDDSCVLESSGKQKAGMLTELSGKELYESAAKLGLEYGEAFRPLRKIRIEGTKILGDLVTPGCLDNEERSQEMQSYLLHPSYLDGALQALLSMLTIDLKENQSKSRKAFLPIRLDRLRMHRSHEACASLNAIVRRRTRRGILADLCLRNEAGELVASASGVRFKAAKLIVRAGDHARFLTTKLISKPLSPNQASKSLSLPKLRQLFEVALPEMKSSRLWRGYHEETELLLELLCSAFTKETLQALTEGESDFSLDHLVEKGVVSESLQSYALSLLWMLGKDGLLRRRPDGRCSLIKRPEDPSAQAIWLTLIESHPEYSDLIRATGRIGLHLSGILSGQRDAADLLPRSWSEESPMMVPGSLASLHELISLVLGRSLSSMQQGERPRILWMLGNRIHGEKILAPWMLSGKCEVIMTVPTSQARRDLLPRLAGYPEVAVQVLDCEKPLPSAASLAGGFDFVVVASGMECISSQEKLEGLNNLLLPEGTLAFAERSSNRLDDFLYGSSRDWWTTEAGELVSHRKNRDDWQRSLQEAGFKDIWTPLSEEGATSGFLVLASAGQIDEQSSSVPEPKSWMILFEDEQDASLALSLQDDLEVLNQAVTISSLSDEEGWRGLLRSLEGTNAELMIITGIQYEEKTAEAILNTLKERMGGLNALLKENEGLASPIPLTIVSTGLFHDVDESGEQENFAATIQGSALLGYLRVARNEYALGNLRLLDVRHGSFNQGSRAIAAEVMSDSCEDEVLLGSFGRKVSRTAVQSSIIPASGEMELRYLDFIQPGSFTNLKWHSGSRIAPNQGELEIEVKAAGLNFRDVMYAMGLLPDEALESGFAGQTVGMELSGIVTRTGEGISGYRPGDEVIAFASKAFSTHAVTKVEAVMKKPADWSFEAAATIPTAFFTVYYSLVELARARSGERVLIHGAAGGVGIAAIQLARHLGLEIFATAGSEEKRDFLRMLGVDHILDSRSLRFADEVMALTSGEGIDIVLNSLAGEAAVKNLRILRPFGRFLELGKRDFYENSRIGLRPFRNNITYHGIDADQLMEVNPSLTAELFAKITALFEEGVLHPLPHTVFDSSDIAEAFRHMQHSKQVGKVVITSPGHSAAEVISTSEAERISLRNDSTYLVTGGTSGFGLRSAEWLAGRGARSLVLASRRGVLDDAGREIVAKLTASGVDVKIVSCDVGCRESLTLLLEQIRSTMPPLRGLIHSAMVIEDGLLQNLSASQLEKVLRPKLVGAMLLDELTRMDRLELFVLYSSATTVFGNPGQGAYVAANLALEALAAARESKGLPATCVAWGPIADVGYLARNQQIKDALGSRMGGRALDSDEALETLDSLISQGIVTTAWLDLEWGKMAKFLPSAKAPRFDCFRHESDEQSAQSGETRSIRQQFAGLNQEETVGLLQEHLAQSIAGILRMDPMKLDRRKSLFDVGMDSLMAVELAATLEESLEIKLPMMVLSEGPTVLRLAERISGMILIESQEHPKESKSDVLQESMRLLAAQHGAEELSEEDLTEIASSLSRATA